MVEVILKESKEKKETKDNKTGSIPDKYGKVARNGLTLLGYEPEYILKVITQQPIQEKVGTVYRKIVSRLMADTSLTLETALSSYLSKRGKCADNCRGKRVLKTVKDLEYYPRNPQLAQGYTKKDINKGLELCGHTDELPRKVDNIASRLLKQKDLRLKEAIDTLALGVRRGEGKARIRKAEDVTQVIELEELKGVPRNKTKESGYTRKYIQRALKGSGYTGSNTELCRAVRKLQADPSLTLYDFMLWYLDHMPKEETTLEEIKNKPRTSEDKAGYSTYYIKKALSLINRVPDREANLWVRTKLITDKGMTLYEAVMLYDKKIESRDIKSNGKKGINNGINNAWGKSLMPDKTSGEGVSARSNKTSNKGTYNASIKEEEGGLVINYGTFDTFAKRYMQGQL